MIYLVMGSNCIHPDNECSCRPWFVAAYLRQDWAEKHAELAEDKAKENMDHIAEVSKKGQHFHPSLRFNPYDLTKDTYFSYTVNPFTYYVKKVDLLKKEPS